MDHATIRGVVVATRRHPSLEGVRFVVAQLEDQGGSPIGDPLVAADALQAGPGQRVWVIHGREAGLSLPVPFNPADLAVVGLVDGSDPVILARVVGRSWSTIEHPIYQGRVVFAVQPVDPAGRPTGAEFLAVDAVGAGPGQLVLVAREGNTARQVLEAPEQPVHSAVVGIVDDITCAELARANPELG